MHCLITGGTGFIGQYLIKALLERDYRITLYARNFDKAKNLFNSSVNLVGGLDNLPADIDMVINLAGEPIVGRRWSKKRKQLLRESRIQTTQALVDWMRQADHKPHTFISGSAIGYYGNYTENMSVDESVKPRFDFASQLCQAWEAAALQAEPLGVRVCLLRTGVVLDKTAGALQKMWLPFRLGLGGRIGDGYQWFSWVHRKDMISLILFLIDRADITGPVNAVAPYPVNNREFTRTFAKALKRPAFLPVPGFILKLLLGEASQLLLEGQQVIPKKLQQSGFEFEYPELKLAIEDIVRS